MRRLLTRPRSEGQKIRGTRASQVWSQSCDAFDTHVASIGISRDLMNLQDSVRMDTPMNVRKQFIIRALEIWLFITDRGSALEHRLYACSGETFNCHPEAIPIPLNL